MSNKPKQLDKGGLPDSTWRKVDKGGEWGCWLWKGSRRRDGYCRTLVRGELWRAHRAVWVHYNGPIPEGMVIDHTCGVRHCVNPDHLRCVTPRQNILDGVGRAAENARKTHCKRGHPFDDENTYRYGAKRWCKTCNRQFKREQRANEKAKRKAADTEE